MRYDPPVFRPPSEASSLILQVALGCSHNACTFCGMYKSKKFRIKSWLEIESDIVSARQTFPGATRVFLADGNALALDNGLLIEIVKKLYNEFPYLERVGIYAGPKDILSKSAGDLKKLREAGLGILYFGLESGSDRVLSMVRKGVTAAQMVEAGRKVLDSGLALSVTVIIGLGGPDLSEEHAIETAAAVSAINPTYLGALTLMVTENTPLYEKIRREEFKLLTPEQGLIELKSMLEKVSLTNCVFRSNHASNYLPLKGTLNQDKAALISILERSLSEPGLLRPEFVRGL